MSSWYHAKGLSETQSVHHAGKLREIRLKMAVALRQQTRQENRVKLKDHNHRHTLPRPISGAASLKVCLSKVIPLYPAHSHYQDVK